MNRTLRTRIWVSAALALLAAACGRSGSQGPTPVPTASPTERQERVYQSLWKAVNDQYVYSDFGGVDWQAAGDATRAKIEGGLTEEEFVAAMRDMIGLLPKGMVAWETREERLARQTSNTATYEGIGAFVSVRAEPQPHIVLLAVMDGSPAQQAGLIAHDSIYAIDGSPVLAEEGLEVIDRVRGPAGTTVKLTVESPDGSRRDVEVTRGQLAASGKVRIG